MNYPCRYCHAPKRHPGCHDTCPDYQADKSEREERNKARDIEVAGMPDTDQYTMAKRSHQHRVRLDAWKRRNRG